MVLKIVQHIDDHFNSLFTIISAQFNKNSLTNFFIFFHFSMQKMENKIMNEKAKIANTLKIFKEQIG